jgi:hypothetical protein
MNVRGFRFLLHRILCPAHYSDVLYISDDYILDSYGQRHPFLLPAFVYSKHLLDDSCHKTEKQNMDREK